MTNVGCPSALSQMVHELEALLRGSTASDHAGALRPVLTHRLGPGAEWSVSHGATGGVVGVILRACGLRVLPEVFSQLLELEHLDLSANQLSSLPERIGSLAHLRHLLLDDNQLGSLPDALGELTRLRWLAVDGNGLPALPTSIGRLMSLEAWTRGAIASSWSPRASASSPASGISA